MADKVSSFVIAFDGSEGNLDAIVSALKGKIRSAVADIQSTTAKVELFSNLETDVQKAAAALADATAKVAAFKTQIDAIKGSGGTVGADLAAQFKLAENAATSASRAYNAQVTQLTALQTKLTAAGVNTGSLAAEQLRLAAALKVATTAATEQSAKGLLGFKTLGDVQPQITALTKAFDTLRLSGTLSAREIAAAQTVLQQKIAAVRGEVSTLSDRFAQQDVSIGSIFSTATAKILGFVAVIGTIGTAISSVISTSRAFSQAVVEIGTVTELSKTELTALGDGAKEIAATIGIDLVAAVKTLKDLIRAGIDPDNALLVLATSAETAKASQQDLGAVVKVGTLLIKGYGVEIGDLQKTFDILFQGMKDGGPTFNELADGLGKLLPVARLANVPIDQLVASLQVMVRAGLPAEVAIADLTKIITKIDTAKAVKALSDLGITSRDLADVFSQVGAKGLDLNQLLNIGLADKRSISGLAALTAGAGGLRDEMDKLSKSAGASAVALAKLAETPKEKIDRLSGSFQVMEANIGASAARAGGLIDLLNKVISVSNTLLKSEQDEDAVLAKFGNTVGIAGLAAAIALDKLTTSAAAAATGVKTAIGSIAGTVAQQISAIDASVTKITGSLALVVTDQQARVKELETETKAGIAELVAAAASDVAALDASRQAQVDTAKATLEIQTKLAADRLKLILDNVALVIKASDDEAKATLAIRKASGPQEVAQEKQTADAILAARVAGLRPFLAELQKNYDDQLKLQKGYVAQIQKVDDEQVTFNESIATKLRAIRNETQSDFDKYSDHVKQIDEDISKARQAFADGDIALGKKYTDSAIGLSETLKGVVNADGVEVVSAFDVQQKKIEEITKAAGQYNAALRDQKALAVDGANATAMALEPAKAALDDITKQLDAVKAKVAEGIKLKVTADQNALTDLIAELDAKLAEKEHLVPIKADLSGLAKDIDDVIAKLKAGTTEGVNTQLDAIEANLVKLAAENPTLKIDTAPATDQIDALRMQVLRLADLKPHLTVDSNVADVQAAIDKLKTPTESTHTVHVVVVGDTGAIDVTTSSSPVGGFARGGVVGSLGRARDAWRGFAGGGFSFPRLSGPLVSGSGSGDTVPASLPSGSFVMRRAASDYYGPGLMSRLALGALGVRHLASGGFASADAGIGFGFGINGTTDPQKKNFLDQFLAVVAQQTGNMGPGAISVTNPNAGYTPGQSFQGNLPPPITLNTRPIPASLITAANVLAYAQEMLLRVGAENPLLGALGADLLAMMAAVQANPNDAASIAQLLRDAETIGANPYIFSMAGKTASSAIQAQPEWFYDWLEQTQAGDLAAALAGTTSGSAVPTGAALTTAISDFAQRFFHSSGFGLSFYTQNPLATVRAVGLAEGGPAGTDTVNAMLTPGEYVISAPAAGALGPDFLHAMNNIHLSRDDLSSIMSPPAPRGRVAHFAEGGPVGDLWGNSGSRLVGGQAGQINNFNMSVNVADLFSADNVRRFLLPVLREIDRRGK